MRVSTNTPYHDEDMQHGCPLCSILRFHPPTSDKAQYVPMASLMAILRATSLALSGCGVVVEDILSQKAVQTIESYPFGNHLLLVQIRGRVEVDGKTGDRLSDVLADKQGRVVACA